MYAQTFVPPVYPEYINPPATPSGAHVLGNVPHLSCYSRDQVSFKPTGVDVAEDNDLYV